MNEELSEILDYPHKPTSKNEENTNGTKTQISPISPPTSQDTQHDSSGNETPTRSTFQREESTPPMPGSFVFEEPPSSPAFSSSNTDNHFTINQALYGTPRRPNYTNPGIAIEPRYNARSPLPPPAPRGDMTPRQLAVFARRKQEFERFNSTRSATPSFYNESFSDEYKPFSEREQAERRRRKKDLEKWREEKEALKRESERLLGGKAANKDGRGRERDIEDAEDVEMEDRPAKRSKSSNFFQSLLTEEEDEFNMSTAGSAFGNFGNKSTEGSRIQSPAASPDSQEGSDTEKETSITTKVKNVLSENNQSKVTSTESVVNAPKSSFEVPTPSPSPSPPLQPVQTFSKSITSHIPKVPSRLRTQTTPSSPAGSPQKAYEVPTKQNDNYTKKDHVSEAVLAVSIPEFTYMVVIANFQQLSSDRLMHFKFPPLGPQPRDFISAEIIIALTSR